MKIVRAASLVVCALGALGGSLSSACGGGSEDGSPTGSPPGYEGGIPAPDTQPATILSMTPNNGADRVSVHAPIQIKFSADMDSQTSATLHSESGDIPSTATFSENNTVLTISPKQPIVAPSRLEVRLNNARDGRGNTVAAGLVWSWTAPLWLPQGDAFEAGAYNWSELAAAPDGHLYALDSYVPDGGTFGVEKVRIFDPKNKTWGAPSGEWGWDTSASIAVDVRTSRPVVFSNGGDGKQTLLSHRWSGAAWEQIGIVSTGKIFHFSAQLIASGGPDGRFVIACEVEHPGRFPAPDIVVYEFHDGTWKQLGTVIEDCADSGCLQALTLDKGGVPYVAHLTAANDGQIRSLSSERWAVVGSTVNGPDDQTYHLSIALDDGNLFALANVYKRTAGSPSRTLFVRRDGANWSLVGGPFSDTLKGASYLAATTLGHVFGYSNSSGATAKLVAFDATTTGWNPIASPAAPSNQPIFAGGASVDSNGIPFVVWADDKNHRVARLNR